MNKIAVIGCFFAGMPVSDGQGVKTKILTEELEQTLGLESVLRIDTYGWRKCPFRLFWNVFSVVRKYNNVLFLTDEGGIKIFPYLLQLANLAGKCKIHYYVVGGWLGKYLDQSLFATSILKKLDAIYVEIPAMARDLEERGFQNVVLVNKFRRMVPASGANVRLSWSAPYKLCYFSRVMKEKGIEDAIAATVQLNKRAGFEKYTLDIFGTIQESYKEAFDKLIQSTPSCVAYKGVVDFRKSTDVLKTYFAMLFPTFYASEGYPNAVVDAFAAGLPVVATRWNYNEDIIRDHEDGMLVNVGDIGQIVAAVEEMAETPSLYRKMRIQCLDRCLEYLPGNAVAKVLAQLK